MGTVVKEPVFRLLKLSDAIREGKTSPQIKERFYLDGGTCALGGAFEACLDGPWIEAQIDLEMDAERRAWLSRHSNLMYAYWKNIYSKMVDHPKNTYGLFLTLAGVITNLNDSFGWSRDQIADWVKTIEDSIPDCYPDDAPPEQQP